ncbi:MAG: DUF488 domain-containing protein [Chloroflexota bacterium]|nr:DUF488 domain-containing protein [Chloroflexota bacterium]
MSQADVWTIGYQGRAIDDFLDMLTMAKVKLLVDIRSKPVSRKPGFSRATLQRHLAGREIDYQHLGALGMPLDLLAQSRSTRDKTPLLVAYRERIASQQAAIDEVYGLLLRQRTCLLCFEADVRQCHREIVADRLHALWDVAAHHL